MIITIAENTYLVHMPIIGQPLVKYFARYLVRSELF